MNIRNANITDIDKIMILEEKIFDLHLKARPDWIEKKSINFDYIKDIITNNTGRIFIAEYDDNIIGHCIVSFRNIQNHQIFHDMLNIEIEDIYIDESYRNKGIAKMLFEEVKKFAKEKGASFIELSVWDFNQNAKQFYEHLGMKTRINRMELKID